MPEAVFYMPLDLRQNNPRFKFNEDDSYDFAKVCGVATLTRNVAAYSGQGGDYKCNVDNGARSIISLGIRLYG